MKVSFQLRKQILHYPTIKFDRAAKFMQKTKNTYWNIKNTSIFKCFKKLVLCLLQKRSEICSHARSQLPHWEASILSKWNTKLLFYEKTTKAGAKLQKSVASLNQLRVEFGEHVQTIRISVLSPPDINLVESVWHETTNVRNEDYRR